MTGDSFGSLANLDLNLLVPLDAILAERNITRAAGRLHVSQPAVSASLAKLRRAFDDPLIVRQGNVTNLTPFAETLVEPVREILQQVDKTLRRRSTFDPRTDARTFSLATSDYTLSVLVGQLLRRLPDAAPQVRLAVRQNVALHPAEVIDESLDLTIMPRDMLKGLEGLPSQSLFVETFSCAVWAKHPEVGETVSVEDLQRLPFLGYQRQPGGRSWVEQHLARQGVELKPEVVLSNFAVAPLLLEGTRLVTFIADRMAALVAGSHDIRTLPSPVEIPPLVETMFWHPRHSDDPAHQWLRRFVADVAATI